jgi:hypothetical protein
MRFHLGQPCKSPAVRDWNLCQMHPARGGADVGKAHPNWKHGARCFNNPVADKVGSNLFWEAARAPLADKASLVPSSTFPVDGGKLDPRHDLPSSPKSGGALKTSHSRKTQVDFAAMPPSHVSAKQKAAARPYRLIRHSLSGMPSPPSSRFVAHGSSLLGTVCHCSCI